MLFRYLIAATLLLPLPALAQTTDAGAMAQAQLSIANQMLDQQKAQILQLGGQLILAQQEIAKLKEAAKPKAEEEKK